jgi:MraZ protein
MAVQRVTPKYPDLSDSTLGFILAESFPSDVLSSATLPQAPGEPGRTDQALASPEGSEGVAQPSILRGRFSVKIDAKGRITIPIEWRQRAGGLGSECYLVRRSNQHFFIFPLAQMLALEQRLIREKMLNQIETVYLCSAGPCACDQQGRLQLPQIFRDACGIRGGSLEMIGAGLKVRVCTPEALERFAEEVKKRSPQANVEAPSQEAPRSGEPDTAAS